MTKSFGEKVLLKNINSNFHAGDKIGIVGVNGCGKTTFLRLLAGEIHPDKGGIGNRNTIAYMRQEIFCTPKMTVYDYLLEYVQSREEYKIYPLLDEFGLTTSLDQPISTLSGGEQKKLQMIAIMLQQAEVLLLDEPTNHLDNQALQKLQEIIFEYSGIVIFVSHDRQFLNMMANKIIEIHDGAINIFYGDYEAYKREKQRLYEKQLQDFVVYQKEKKKRESRLTDMKQRASVYINPARGRLIKNKEKYFAREVLANSVDKPEQEKNITLSAQGGTHKSKRILELHKYAVGFDDKILIQNIDLELRGTERIQIAGPNGSGKTTLIKVLWQLCISPQQSEYIKIGNNISCEYFDQKNLDLQSPEIVYKRFTKNSKTPLTETSLRSQLAMIGLSQQEIFAPMNQLSYGQRVKVKFLQMLSDKIDVLILDEPTNHLDIPTREAIEDMLQDYEGSLIFVSHDQYFAKQIRVNTEYIISNNHLKKIEIAQT